MKKINLLLLLGTLSAIIAFTGCNNEDPNYAVEFSSTSEMSFTKDATTTPQTRELKGVGTWDITVAYAAEGSDWLTVTPMTGSGNKTVSFSVGANESVAERSATVTAKLREAELKTSFVVKQTGTELSLSLSTDEIDFAWDELRVDREIIVTTNLDDYELSVTYDDPEVTGWISYQKDNNSARMAFLVATESMNGTPVERKGTITVTGEGVEPQTIAVSQASKTEFPITMSSEELFFAPNGNYLTKTISAASGETTFSATVDKEYGWITSATFDGSILSVTVSENTDAEQRIGYVTVNNKFPKNETSFKVTQLAEGGIDLSGEWNWSAKSTINVSAWDTAATFNGQVMVEPTDTGFAILNMKGSFTEAEDLTPKIFITLDDDDDELYLGYGVMYNAGTGATAGDRMFTVTLYGTNNTYGLLSFEVPTIPIARTIVDDGENITETLTFPATYTLNLDDFPNAADDEGLEHVITYSYAWATYNRFNPEIVQKMNWVDHFRDIVLTRNIE